VFCSTKRCAFYIISALYNEARFCRGRIISIHNQHQWAEENPDGVVHSRRPQQLNIIVWAGIVRECLVGPHVLSYQLTGNHCRDFVLHDLPKLLEDVPLEVRARVWYVHDGAPAHSSRAVRDVLSNSYNHGWIGRGGPTAWPPLSPDLNPLVCYLWGHLNPVCVQILLTTKRHFTIALWIPVKLSATAPASLSGCGGPSWDVSRRALNLMEGILGTRCKCNLSVTSH
jgi:hypothetical protein